MRYLKLLSEQKQNLPLIILNVCGLKDINVPTVCFQFVSQRVCWFILVALAQLKIAAQNTTAKTTKRKTLNNICKPFASHRYLLAKHHSCVDGQNHLSLLHGLVKMIEEIWREPSLNQRSDGDSAQQNVDSIKSFLNCLQCNKCQLFLSLNVKAKYY